MAEGDAGGSICPQYQSSVGMGKIGGNPCRNIHNAGRAGTRQGMLSRITSSHLVPALPASKACTPCLDSLEASTLRSFRFTPWLQLQYDQRSHDADNAYDVIYIQKLMVQEYAKQACCNDFKGCYDGCLAALDVFQCGRIADIRQCERDDAPNHRYRHFFRIGSYDSNHGDRLCDNERREARQYKSIDRDGQRFISSHQDFAEYAVKGIAEAGAQSNQQRDYHIAAYICARQPYHEDAACKRKEKGCYLLDRQLLFEDEDRHDHHKERCRIQQHDSYGEGCPLYGCRIGQIIDKKASESGAQKPFEIFFT